MVKPLIALLKKDTTWQWTDSVQQVFEQLKEVICKAPVLVFPNFQQIFCVETDTCGQGIAVVL